MFKPILNQSLILLILLFATLVGLYNLGDTRIGADELKTLNVIKDQTPFDSFTVYHSSNHIPYVFLLTSLYQLTTEIYFLRLVGVAMGILAVAVAYRSSRALLKPIQPAGKTNTPALNYIIPLLVAFLLIITPIFTRYLREMRGYSTTIFLGTVMFFCLWQVVQTYQSTRQVNWRYWAVFIVATVLCVYTHFFTVFALVAATLLVVGERLFDSPSPPRLSPTSSPRLPASPLPRLFADSLIRSYLISVIAIGILLAVIIAPLAQQIIAVPSTEELSAPEFGPFAPTLDFVRYFVESLSIFNPFGDDQILARLFFGVVILGCVRGLWRSESRRSTLWLAAWWLLPFLTNLITLNFVPAAQVRYYLFTLPAYLQLGLYGLLAVIEVCLLPLRWTPLRPALQRPVLAIALPLLVLGLTIPRLTEVTQGLTRLVNDQAWTRVAAYLRSEVRPGDIVLCEVYELSGGDEDKCRWQLNEFEGLTKTSPVLYFNALASYRQAEQQRELLQQPGRAWFVLYFRQPPGEKEITFEESPGLTAKKFGRTWVLQVDSADALLKNIIACGEWLLRTLPDDDHQFRYNLDLAQLYALDGDQKTANQHVEQAFQIQQTSNEPAWLPELRAVAAMVRFYAPARPAPQHALEVNFDNRLKLRGYSLEPELLSPGTETQANLSLYWQVLTPLEKDYSVFVHLRDAGGKVVGHLDFQPYDAIYPTSYWPVGAELREARPLALPQELPPGQYTLVIGLYLPDDLSRLRIVEDTGGENAVTLGMLTIQGS